jgi:hypothetical protein
MFYAFRVNSSLTRLGISPTLVAKTHRAGLQMAGAAARNTPQEVAVFIAAQLPLIYRVNMRSDLIIAWIANGKINHKKPEMQSALGDLALWDLMSLP